MGYDMPFRSASRYCTVYPTKNGSFCIYIYIYHSAIINNTPTYGVILLALTPIQDRMWSVVLFSIVA